MSTAKFKVGDKVYCLVSIINSTAKQKMFHGHVLYVKFSLLLDTFIYTVKFPAAYLPTCDYPECLVRSAIDFSNQHIQFNVFNKKN